ncbi:MULTISPECIES: hypothetical protein [unclassified Burkholderia]|uniref:hypothetical protein n=1 Tax=unclassified Burkholderia TaxID=2613784 RepID=UPI0016263E42|nr:MULTISPECIES: hypothetical protein [unclassified Burkholderia]
MSAADFLVKGTVIGMVASAATVGLIHVVVEFDTCCVSSSKRRRNNMRWQRWSTSWHSRRRFNSKRVYQEDGGSGESPSKPLSLLTTAAFFFCVEHVLQSSF